MKDMIEFTLEDDEEYGIAPTEIPKLNRVLDIIREVSRSDIYAYEDYINDMRIPAIEELFENSREELRDDLENLNPEAFREKYEDIIVEFEYDADDPANSYLELENKSLAEYDAEGGSYEFSEKYGLPQIEGSYIDLMFEGMGGEKLKSNYEGATFILTEVFEGESIKREILSEYPKNLIADIKNKRKGAGIYWSYDSPRAYGDFRSWSGEHTYSVVLTASFSPEAVNKVKTLAANLSRPQEEEIRIKKKAEGKMKEVCICDFDNCDCQEVDWNFYA